VDKEQDGYYTLLDGTVTPTPDRPEQSEDFYYADYISGTALWYADGFYNNPTYGNRRIKERNYAFDFDGSPISSYTIIDVLGENDMVEIQSNHTLFDFIWDIGDQAIVADSVHDETGMESWLTGSLTVTGVEPVPIPNAIWLLNSGLICLVGLRRKFKK